MIQEKKEGTTMEVIAEKKTMGAETRGADDINIYCEIS